MRRVRRAGSGFLASVLIAGLAGAGQAETVVVWAPGYPGTAEQATRAMDDLADALAEASGGRWSPTLIYEPSLDRGQHLLEDPDTVGAIVPAAVLAAFGEDRSLEPVLRIVPAGDVEEIWSLVARAGSVTGPRSLDGWEIHGLAGVAPAFVRGPVLGGWGELPPTTEIVFTSRVRSALRRAAAGENVAVLLDRAQTEALAALPFASELEVVARSPEMPSSFFCNVRGALSAERLDTVRSALLRLGELATGREAMSAMRIARFAAIADGGRN